MLIGKIINIQAKNVYLSHTLVKEKTSKTKILIFLINENKSIYCRQWRQCNHGAEKKNKSLTKLQDNAEVVNVDHMNHIKIHCSIQVVDEYAHGDLQPAASNLLLQEEFPQDLHSSVGQFQIMNVFYNRHAFSE